jgi:hypothetical protein
MASRCSAGRCLRAQVMRHVGGRASPASSASSSETKKLAGPGRVELGDGQGGVWRRWQTTWCQWPCCWAVSARTSTTRLGSTRATSGGSPPQTPLRPAGITVAPRSTSVMASRNSAMVGLTRLGQVVGVPPGYCRRAYAARNSRCGFGDSRITSTSSRTSTRSARRHSTARSSRKRSHRGRSNA